MAELNEAAGYDLTYLFFFNPQDIRELGFLLRRDEFDYPVCIDADDEMNRLESVSRRVCTANVSCRYR